MDNSIWFFRGRSAFSIPWVFSSNMLNAVDGKHFGFNMLSSSVAHALLILIFSHDHAVVAMPCGDGATYMVCHSLRKHRSEFAQNNWFLCCEYFYFGSYLLRLLSRWSCISFQKLYLLLLSPFDFKLAFLCGTCHDYESIIIYTNSLSYNSFVVCLWWNIVYYYKWKLSCQLTGITVKFWSF